MIDIHTHVLPGIDDGAKNIEDSVNIIKELIIQGVTELIATPHIISGEYDNNQKIIDDKYKQLKTELKKNKIEIKIHTGAELYLEPNTIEKLKNNNLTLGNSKYVLVESSLQKLPDNFENILFQLQQAGYKPIIAHAERFQDFLNNFNLLINILNRGIFVQINAGSFFGSYGIQVKDFAHKLLENGCVHFIASDVHNLRKRTVKLQKAYNFITENYTQDLAELLFTENPRRLLKDQEIENMIQGYWDEENSKKTFIEKFIGFFKQYFRKY